MKKMKKILSFKKKDDIEVCKRQKEKRKKMTMMMTDKRVLEMNKKVPRGRKPQET